MRIIFVTPLLWRRLDRAVRRREEGQALILVALAAVALVAVVGLAVDGGLAYLEAQKLQRAADNASLAGVVWVPNQAIVADGRAKLASQANGYAVYKETNTSLNTYVTQNWSYDEVMDSATTAGQRTMFLSGIPQDTQYRVTLGVKAHRYFLGVIGLGDYYIQRTATAQYSRQIRLGSSFNYFGSSGVLYDPSVNGSGSNDENQTYARYVTNRCNQVPPPGQSLPSPCVGTFWANISGTDAVHSSGDAYNPVGDGYKGTNTVVINGQPFPDTSTQANPNCGHTTQPNSWFTSDSSGSTNGLVPIPGSVDTVQSHTCNDDKASISGSAPRINWDIHPDSTNRRNFGYEIGIEVKKEALLIPANAAAPHTNLNVSIYDAALADVGRTNNFGTGDGISTSPNNYGNRDIPGQTNPVTTGEYKHQVPPSNQANALFNPNTTNPLAPFYPQKYITYTTEPANSASYAYGPPYTGTTQYGTSTFNQLPTGLYNGQCPKPAGASYDPTGGGYSANDREDQNKSVRRCLSQYWISDTNAITSYYNNNASDPNNPNQVSPYYNNSGVSNFGVGQPYRFNETRTRYTLYFPPAADGVPSTYNNVSGRKIASFEVGDMSIRLGGNTDAQTVSASQGYPNKLLPSYYLTARMPLEREPLPKYTAVNGSPVTPSGWLSGTFQTENPSAATGYDTSNYDAGTTGSYGQNISFCYMVSLNPPSVVVNDPRSGLPTINAASTAVPINTAQFGNYYTLTTPKPWDDTQFVFACPSSTYLENTGSPVEKYASDYYWNGLFPTRYFTAITGRPIDAEDVTTYPSYPSARQNVGGIKNVFNYTVNLTNNRPVIGWVPVADNDPEISFYPFKVKPANTDFVDPAQECRISVSSAPPANSLQGRGNNSTYSVQSDSRTSIIEPLYEYGSPRMPFNAAYGDRINYFSVVNGKIVTQYWSRHGWRCNWDFDSDYDPRFNPLKPGSNEPLDQSGSGNLVTNNGYSYYGNGKVEPFFHLTDWTWDSAGNRIKKISPSDGKTVDPGSPNAIVRPGIYMLQVQTYGGPGSNRYSVKAEYENAALVTYTVGYDPNNPNVSRTVTFTKPTPNVFGITAMSLYTNATNSNSNPVDVLFDLAYISPDNAGSTAILQLFDPGDVSAESLKVSILAPSKSGNRLTSNNKVAKGEILTPTLQYCPFFISNISNCKIFSTTDGTVDMVTSTPTGKSAPAETLKYPGYYNDAWVFMTFQIPSRDKYNTYLSECNLNNVPEQSCYYFQVDYQLGRGTANDSTTWQIVVQGAPVRLLR